MEQNIFQDQEFWRWGPLKGWVVTADFPCTGILVRMPLMTGYEWAAATLLVQKGEMIWGQNWLPMLKSSTEAFYGVICNESKRAEVRVGYEKVVQQLQQYAAQVYRDGLGSLSNDELLAQYDLWRDRFMDFWGWASPAECATFGGEQEIRNAVEKDWSGKDVAVIMEVLTMPTELSFFQRAELDLLKRVIGGSDEEEAFRAHVEGYYWLDNGYYGARRRTVDDARQLLAHLVKEHGDPQAAVRAIGEYQAGLEVRRVELQKKYGIKDELMDLSRALGGAISWQDERKAEQFLQMDVLMVFLKEIASRFSHSFDDLLWLRAGEIRELVHDRKGVTELAARRSLGCAIVASKDGVEVWEGERGQQLVMDFWDPRETEGKLRGMVASFGAQDGSKVEGVARIVLDPRQAGDFQDGEVLVAPMTSPDYMPIIRKAAAIVTDEGGLTAHAAVVSRELGIPCILGTKSATKRISSGDHVILHLDTGEISIKL